MENEQIANLMAEKMYGPSTTDTEFAFQLFVEKIVLPIDRDGYTHDEIKM